MPFGHFNITARGIAFLSCSPQEMAHWLLQIQVESEDLLFHLVYCRYEIKCNKIKKTLCRDKAEEQSSAKIVRRCHWKIQFKDWMSCCKQLHQPVWCCYFHYQDTLNSSVQKHLFNNLDYLCFHYNACILYLLYRLLDLFYSSVFQKISHYSSKDLAMGFIFMFNLCFLTRVFLFFILFILIISPWRPNEFALEWKCKKL